MIHIYYGFGKGKTTAAIGCGIRAAGAGFKVSLVQFLKNDKSSELNALDFDIFKSPHNLPFHPDCSYQKWVDGAVNYIMHSDSDMIILDEFLDVIDSFVSLDTALDILAKLSDKEIIITGHKLIEELNAKADYVTCFEKIKHPFDDGISARKGIEY